jgi:hypothetical protein
LLLSLPFSPFSDEDIIKELFSTLIKTQAYQESVLPMDEFALGKQGLQPEDITPTLSEQVIFKIILEGETTYHLRRYSSNKQK